MEEINCTVEGKENKKNKDFPQPKLNKPLKNTIYNQKMR